MFERFKNWLLPSRRIALEKRRLERIAREAGASRSMARSIVAEYFRNTGRGV